MQASPIRPVRSGLWWLHEGNRALRRGFWKLVAAKGEPWELYDLSIDRAESKNLVEAHPDLAKSLAEQWEGMTREIQQTHQHGVPVKELVVPVSRLHSKGVRRSSFGLRII